ncbi:MAG: hypothetical protein RI894_905 [Bacteroidota bacterium]|jgi:hypothetical protein
MRTIFSKIVIALILLLPSFAQATHVSSAEAGVVARNFYRWSIRNAYNGEQSELLYTELMRERAVPLYYIFNVGTHGYVIVAADDACTPILGWSDERNISLQNPSPEWKYYMDNFAAEITYIINQNLQSDNAIKRDWNDWRTSNANRAMMAVPLAPLVACRWDQGAPYSNTCPMNAAGTCQALTGCVATAMAQIMYYWRYPTTAAGSYSYSDNAGSVQGTFSENFANSTYDWANMTDTYSGASTAAQNAAVAKLMRSCGVSVAMDYGGCGGDGGSGSTTAGGQPSASDSYSRYFGYNATVIQAKSSYNTDAAWKAVLDAQLDAGQPMQHRGTDTNGAGGHSWVCDGRDASGNYNMNWGWSGGNNGYYAVSALNPGGFMFNGDPKVVTNIRPSSCVLDYNIASDPSPAFFNYLKYEARNTITSSAILTTGTTRIYDAGSLVRLLPGFIAPTGIAFRAYNNGCQAARTANPNSNASNNQNSTLSGNENLSATTSSNVDGFRARPNPFVTETQFEFSLVEKQQVSLCIRNAVGQTVAQLVPTTNLEAGQYRYSFNAEHLPSGVYYATLITQDGRLTQKVILAK